MLSLHNEAKGPVLGINVSQVTLQQDLSQSSSNLTMAIENPQDAQPGETILQAPFRTVPIGTIPQ